MLVELQAKFSCLKGWYTMAQIPYKIYLDESELPQAWYNLRADMKNKPAPLLNPATHQPMTFDELRPVFCDELVRQELDDTTPYFDIPGEILDVYKICLLYTSGRPHGASSQCRRRRGTAPLWGSSPAARPSR